MSTIEVKSNAKVFGGQLIRLTHFSEETKTPMTLAVYLPTTADRSERELALPYILYLSGLTCTDENVCQKSGVFRSLAEKKIAFVAPDTSPRGANIPGEEDGWDFGTGAGFYVDATQQPWASHYRMYSYVVKELPALLAREFPCLDARRVGVTGHSMGGHGALTIALKNQAMFKSVSAFAPICNPINCPWGVKAFTGYLGEDKEHWRQYDASELLRAVGDKTAFDDILIDVGTADGFYKNGQLLPEAFTEAAAATGQRVTLRFQEGYDHSYYFISSFIEEHVEFHAKRL